MTIDRTEAAASLRDIDQVTRRASVAGAYRHASPHLLLWGAIWVVGYTATGMTPPEQWGYVWAPLILIGAVGATLIGMCTRRAPGEAGAPSSSPIFTALVIAGATLAFMLSSYALFQPRGTAPYLAFPALVVGLIYTTIGGFGMPRFILIGFGVVAVAMAGYLFAPEQLSYWIAAAGGGGLLLGGLWLRKA